MFFPACLGQLPPNNMDRHPSTVKSLRRTAPAAEVMCTGTTTADPACVDCADVWMRSDMNIGIGCLVRWFGSVGFGSVVWFGLAGDELVGK